MQVLECDFWRNVFDLKAVSEFSFGQWQWLNLLWPLLHQGNNFLHYRSNWAQKCVQSNRMLDCNSEMVSTRQTLYRIWLIVLGMCGNCTHSQFIVKNSNNNISLAKPTMLETSKWNDWPNESRVIVMPVWMERSELTLCRNPPNKKHKYVLTVNCTALHGV